MAIGRGPLAVMLAGAALWASAVSAQGDKPPLLEQRIMAKLMADPALATSLGTPAPQMAKVAWMVGDWEVRATSVPGNEVGTTTVTSLFGGRWLETRGAYGRGMKDVAFLGYDSNTRKWQRVDVNNFGITNTMQADDWKGDSIVFEGDIVVLGVSAHLRQTMTKVSDDEYRVQIEERIDGVWHQMDHHHYKRVGK